MLLVWVALAITSERAAPRVLTDHESADAQLAPLFYMAGEAIRQGTSLLEAKRRSRFDDNEVPEDLTPRYEQTMTSMQNAYTMLADKAASKETLIQNHVDSIRSIMEDISQTEAALEAVMDTHLEDNENFVNQLEQLDIQINNSFLFSYEQYAKLLPEIELELNTERDDNVAQREQLLTDLTQQLADGSAAAQLYIQQAMSDFKREFKLASKDNDDLIDEAGDEADELIEGYGDAVGKNERELKKATVKVLVRQKKGERGIKKFERDLTKDQKGFEKDDKKYQKKVAKNEKKAYDKMNKMYEKVVKEVKKDQAKAAKSGQKELAKAEKGLFKENKKTNKYMEKEGKVFAKDAAKAAKENTKTAVALTKQIGEEVKDAEALREDVLERQSSIQGLLAHYEQLNNEAGVDLRDEMNEERKDSADHTKEASADAKDKIKDLGTSLMVDAKELAHDLHDKVTGPNTEKLDEVQRSAQMAMLSNLETAEQTTEKTKGIAKEGHNAARVHQEEFDDLMHAWNAAVLKVSTAKTRTAADLTRVLQLQKVTFMSMGRQFATENAVGVKTLPQSFVDMVNKMNEDVRMLASTFNSDLDKDQADSKEVLGLLMQEARDMKMKSDGSINAISALQSKDYAAINRALQTSSKLLSGAVSSANNSVSTDVVAGGNDDLARANREQMAFINKLIEKAEKENKKAAAQSAELNGSELRRIMNLLSQVDTNSELRHSSLLAGGDADLETVNTIAKEVKLNTKELQRDQKNAERAQGKLGPAALSSLQMALQAVLQKSTGQERNLILQLFGKERDQERQQLEKALQDFGDKTTEERMLGAQTIEKIQEKIRALGLEANKKSHALNAEVDGGADVANQIQAILADTANRLRSETNTIERESVSNLKASHRQQAGIFKDAQDAVSRETEGIGKDLRSVKQVLDKKEQGIAADARSEEQELSTLAQTDLQGALTRVGLEPEQLKQQEDQAGALSHALGAGFQDGMERFDRKTQALKLQTAGFEREIRDSRSTALKTEQLETKGRLSEDRLSEGTKVLGEKTGSVSQDAAAAVTMAGSGVETQLKGESLHTDMRMQTLDAQEQAIYVKQAAMDSDLASAVGTELQNIDQVELDAAGKQKEVEAGKLTVEQLLADERQSLEKNIGYLKNFSLASSERVTEMLDHVTAVLEHRLSHAEEGMQRITDRQQHIQDKLAETMSSKAMEQLRRLAQADDYAHLVEHEDEYVKDWMLEHYHESEGFRERVEKGFADHGAVVEAHEAEMAASEQEWQERARLLQHLTEKRLEQYALQSSAGSTDAIQQGVDAAMAAFHRREQANEALDQARIDAVQAAQDRLHEHGAQMLARGKDALDKVRLENGEGSEKLFEMEDLLKKLGATHEGEIDAKMQELQERQRNFDRQLMFATAPAPPSDAKTYTEKDFQFLLHEATELSSAHEELQRKHAAAGQQIGGLLQKLTAALEKVQSQKTDTPAALVEKKGAEAQLRTQR